MPDQDTAAKPRERPWDLLKTVGGGLLLALVLRIFVFQPFTIPSESMEPGLLVGDYIVVSKFDYGFSRHSIPFSPPLFSGRVFGRDPARGDVAVFQLPRQPAVSYIKRVIGLPGDRVQVIGGTVLVNGKAIRRTEAGVTQDPGAPGVEVARYVEHRADGRPYLTFDRGAGREGDDTGVYLVPAGHYFMMGDNRDNSLDSRWPRELGVGLAPAENLVGKARFILLSWEGGASLFKPWTWFTRFQPGRAFKGLT